MKKLICILLSASVLFVSGLAAAAANTSINMGALIADKAKWEGTMNEPNAAGQTEWTSDSLLLKAGVIKSAGYQGHAYRNFVLDFKYNVTWPEDAGDWGGMLTFRDNTPGLHTWEKMDNQGTYKKAYGVYFYLDPNADEVEQAGEISITRFVNDDGDTGPENLGDQAVCKNLNLSGKDHIYRLICEDVSNGVHIVLYMDGKTIIDFVDSSSKALKQEGKFMVMNHGPRSVRISGVKSSELPDYNKAPANTSSATISSKQTVSTGNIVSSQKTTSAEKQSSAVEQVSSAVPESASDEPDSLQESSADGALSEMLSSSEVQQTGGTSNNGSMLTIIIIIAVTVVIIGGVTIAGIIIMKKKKQ